MKIESDFNEQVFDDMRPVNNYSSNMKKRYKIKNRKCEILETILIQGFA